MLTRITPDLAVAEHELRLPGGVRLPARMTAARLPDGAVALVSPVPIDDALARELEALGPVRYLVGPNLYHHLYLRAARERYPEAALVGAPGLAAKRAGLAFDHELGDGAPPWGDGLEPIVVRGAPRMNEVAFHHPASRALITTDLVFNMTGPLNLATRAVLGLMGTRGRLARSRAWLFLIKDRRAYADSVDRLLAVDADRLVMAHGAIVNEGASEALRRVLSRP